MGRIVKKFKRKEPFRDARLIVIAAEGDKTEKQYFEGIKEYIDNPRIKIQILSRKDPALSAPKYVMSELNQYVKEHGINGNDELWMLIDFDRWGEPNIKDVAAKCVQKKFNLAVSNPRFEIWLLMHFKNLKEYTPENLNKILTEKDGIEREIASLINGYNKSNLQFEKFEAHIETAINNAKELDNNPENRWPDNAGTKVYVLADRILK